jgi:hypothetical protein
MIEAKPETRPPPRRVVARCGSSARRSQDPLAAHPAAIHRAAVLYKYAGVEDERFSDALPVDCNRKAAAWFDGEFESAASVVGGCERI